MSEPKEQKEQQEKPNNVSTKDYWSIILLIAKGFKPIRIEVEVDCKTGQKFLSFVFPSVAQETYDKKQRGEVIAIDDFAKVEYASRIFKSNLHLIDD